jgi:hypothetical protein
MKLWKDRDELTPVRWFFTKPGAKVFEPMSSFRSLKTWDRGSDRTGKVGEKLGVTPYDKGGNSLDYEGLRHCGSDLAMQEGGASTRDPVIVTGSTMPVCLTAQVGTFSTRIPPNLIATIVGPTLCPIYNGVQLPLTFLGQTPVVDLSTPGDGDVFTGFSCAWAWLSPKLLVKEEFVNNHYMVLGVALSASGEGVPEGCPIENCRNPRVYWKVIYKHNVTGVETVAIRFETNFDPIVSGQVEPLTIVLSDAVVPGSVFQCILGGSNPLTRTVLVLTRAP